MMVLWLKLVARPYINRLSTVNCDIIYIHGCEKKQPAFLFSTLFALFRVLLLSLSLSLSLSVRACVCVFVLRKKMSKKRFILATVC